MVNIPVGGDTREELERKADKALERANKKKKNSFKLINDSNRQTHWSRHSRIWSRRCSDGATEQCFHFQSLLMDLKSVLHV